MKYIKFVSYTFVVVSILLLSGIVTRPAYATICGGTPCVDSADVINGTLLGVDHSGTIQMPGTNITNNSVQSIDIQDGTITSTDIQDGTVTSTDIQDGTITGTDILNGTIGGLDINSAEIQSRVSGTCAAGNSIRSVNADGTVVCEPDDSGGTASDVVCAGCVGSTDIGADACGATQIAADAVGAAEIATGAVGSAEVLDNSLTATDLATSSVGADEIAAGAVGSSEIAAGAVGSSQINNAQVQSRVSGTCAAGNSIRTVNADGSVVCEPDDTGGTASDVVCAGCVGTSDIGANIDLTASNIFMNLTQIHRGNLGILDFAWGWDPSPTWYDGLWIETDDYNGGGFYTDGDVSVIYNSGWNALLEVVDIDFKAEGPRFKIDQEGRVYIADRSEGLGWFAGGCYLYLSDDICFKDYQNGRLSIRNTADTGWASVEAGAYFNLSSKNEKKNIDKLTREDYNTVLGKIKTLDVFRFLYKNESDDRYPHIGLIAEESPKEVLSPEGTSVNLSDYTSFLLAGLKAQQALIEEQQASIEVLQQKISEIDAIKAQLGEMEALRVQVSKLQVLLHTTIAQIQNKSNDNYVALHSGY